MIDRQTFDNLSREARLDFVCGLLAQHGMPTDDPLREREHVAVAAATGCFIRQESGDVFRPWPGQCRPDNFMVDEIISAIENSRLHFDAKNYEELILASRSDKTAFDALKLIADERLTRNDVTPELARWCADCNSGRVKRPRAGGKGSTADDRRDTALLFTMRALTNIGLYASHSANLISSATQRRNSQFRPVSSANIVKLWGSNNLTIDPPIFPDEFMD